MNATRQRVRSASGALGWREGGEIRSDADPGLALMAYWRTNSQADQEDLGVPAEGWFTASGYWQEVDASAVPADQVTERLQRVAAGYFG